MSPTLQNSSDSGDPLEGALASADENQLVEDLKKIKTSQPNRADLVAQILRHTGSARVRNAAAVALADMRAPDAAKVLIEVLSRPDSEKSRGTLLYALEEVRGKAPLKLLVDIILSGTYEARQEATRIISSGNFKSTHSELQNIIDSLKSPSFTDEERDYSIKKVIAAISRPTKKRASYSFYQFIGPLARTNQLSNAKTKAILKDFSFLVVQHLKKGEGVRVAGLGYFATKPRLARSGRKLSIRKAVRAKGKTAQAKRKLARAKGRSRAIMFRPSKDLTEAI